MATKLFTGRVWSLLREGDDVRMERDLGTIIECPETHETDPDNTKVTIDIPSDTTFSADDLREFANGLYRIADEMHDVPSTATAFEPPTVLLPKKTLTVCWCTTAKREAIDVRRRAVYAMPDAHQTIPHGLTRGQDYLMRTVGSDDEVTAARGLVGFHDASVTFPLETLENAKRGQVWLIECPDALWTLAEIVEPAGTTP
jgi:hypothetical protein